MTATYGVAYIWAYVLGLLFSATDQTILGFPVGAIALLGMGGTAAIAVPRYWRAGLNARGWLVCGLIGCLAVFYCLWRSPQPSSSDISTLLNEERTSVAVVVEGQVESAPRQTRASGGDASRSQNKQFWLRVTHGTESESKEGTTAAFYAEAGRLYVTIPAGEAEGLEPGEGVRLTGRLYTPKPPTNPGSFDFKRYLERQGCFAALRADAAFSLEPEWNPGFWLKVQGRIGNGLWQVRQRISAAFVQGLGDRNGMLVGGMVLGRKAVDLSPEISDAFTQAGMAHTLAASGFHVSLLLGMVLWFARNLSSSQQAWIGGCVLLGYIGLTGIQPSVLRAGLMGVAALLGKVYEQKTRPVGVLLAVAVLLLLSNPLWIFNLGFQLSFLATLGLLVTVPPLTKALDWLPPTVATAIAIPLSAYLWTLPVQLFSFGTVSTYSIVVNIILTPVVVITSLGGMVCAAIALISPALGSLVVKLLYYPTEVLITGVAEANELPGSVYAVGTISTLQLIALYGLFGWVWWKSQWRVLPTVAGLLAIALVFLPAKLMAATQSPITFLNTGDRPVIVVRQQGEVGLIHAGSDTDIQFTVLPFLKQQGINRIDWAIATSSGTDSIEQWQKIANVVPITDLWLHSSLARNMDLHGINNPMTFDGKAVSTGSLEFRMLMTVPEVNYFALSDRKALLQAHRTWLMVQNEKSEDIRKLTTLELPQAQVLQWSSYAIPAEVVQTVQPTTIIGVESVELIGERPPELVTYALQQDGAIQWQAQHLSPISNELNFD